MARVWSLVGAAVLPEHLIGGNGLSAMARWQQLRAAPLTAWAQAVWARYMTRATSTESGSGYDIGLVTIALVFALSLGWLGGSSLYDWFHFRAPESGDSAAISALIEKIIAEPNQDQRVKADVVDTTKSREGRKDETKNPLGYVVGN
jgi:hypothetical protein